MTERDLSRLTSRLNKEVTLRFRDGECALVKLILVSAEEGEVVYELRTTDRPAKYKPRQWRATHLAKIAEIATVDDEPLSTTADNAERDS
jgi:hypothetical protein